MRIAQVVNTPFGYSLSSRRAASVCPVWTRWVSTVESTVDDQDFEWIL